MSHPVSGNQSQRLRGTEQRRYCPYCSREFHKSDHYNRHVRSHINEKPFGCKICDKFYSRRDTLLRHLKTHKATRRDGPRLPSVTSTNDLEDDNDRANSHLTTAARTYQPHDRRTSIPRTLAAPRELDFDAADATIDLTVEGNGAESIAVPCSEVISQHEPMGNLLLAADPATNPGPLTVGGIFDHTSASMSTDLGLPSELFARHQVAHDHDSTTAHIMDATNWLLDENFVDIFDVSNEDLAYNEPPSLTERSRSRPPTWSPLNKNSGPLRLPLPLSQMWYVQTQRTTDDLDRDCEPPGKKAVRDIDEVYRKNMVNELRSRLRSEPFPSMEFLNLCIHLFFTRFNVALPFIHGPTFMARSDNIMLVLMICAAGTMTILSDTATRIGAMLFEGVNKVGNGGSWERELLAKPHLTRDVIKTSTIGQTFALLSADPAHRTMAAAYHGGLISIARHAKLFTKTARFDLPDATSPEQLERLWRKWASHEEMKRAVVIMHIHDAEIAALFGYEPILRHKAHHLPLLAPAELFQAPNAAMWAIKYRSYQESRHASADPLAHPQARFHGLHPGPITVSKDYLSKHSMLVSWATLSGIGATICECWHLDVFSSRQVAEFEKDLAEWYTSSGNCCQAGPCQSLGQDELQFCLRPLWHHTFMALTTDFDLLEGAAGREGAHITPSTVEHVKLWIASPASKRCLLHALCLQNLVASTTVEAAVAIHTPRILFLAALCWYCYMLYLSYCTSPSDFGSSLLDAKDLEYLTGLPEAQLLHKGRLASNPQLDVFHRATSDLNRILGAGPAEMKTSTLCVLESSLHRLGSSGVSQKFADLVQAFMTGYTR